MEKNYTYTLRFCGKFLGIRDMGQRLYRAYGDGKSFVGKYYTGVWELVWLVGG